MYYVKITIVLEVINRVVPFDILGVYLSVLLLGN